MVNEIIKQLRMNTVDYGKLRKNAVKYGNNGELRWTVIDNGELW